MRKIQPSIMFEIGARFIEENPVFEAWEKATDEYMTNYYLLNEKNLKMTTQEANRYKKRMKKAGETAQTLDGIINKQ